MSKAKPSKFVGQFVRLPMAFLQSKAFRWKLPGGALRLLGELMSRHNGRNNGKIFCSYREASALLGLSQAAYDLGAVTLEERGIIACTKPGNRAEKKATEWRLTFLADAGEIPTNEYLLWQPPKLRRDCIGNRYSAVSKTNTDTPGMISETDTVRPQKLYRKPIRI